MKLLVTVLAVVVTLHCGFLSRAEGAKLDKVHKAMQSIGEVISKVTVHNGIREKREATNNNRHVFPAAFDKLHQSIQDAIRAKRHTSKAQMHKVHVAEAAFQRVIDQAHRMDKREVESESPFSEERLNSLHQTMLTAFNKVQLRRKREAGGRLDAFKRALEMIPKLNAAKKAEE